MVANMKHSLTSLGTVALVKSSVSESSKHTLRISFVYCLGISQTCLHPESDDAPERSPALPAGWASLSLLWSSLPHLTEGFIVPENKSSAS